MFTVKSIDRVHHCCKLGGIPIFQTPREKKIGLCNREYKKLWDGLVSVNDFWFMFLEGLTKLEFQCITHHLNKTPMVKHLPINCTLDTTYHPVVSRDKTGFQNTANCDS